MEKWESLVERKIREAQERGEFDNLPGAGKPLANLDKDDPEWWIKGYLEREKIDFSDALPPAMQLRKEARAMPGSLTAITSEHRVRERLEDYNARVMVDRRRPASGPTPPIWAPTVDVEDMVRQWRDLRGRG